MSGAVPRLRRLRLKLWLARLSGWVVPGHLRRLYFLAVVVGLLGAVAAWLFKFATLGLQYFFSGGHPGGQVSLFQHLAGWQRVALPAVGGLAAGIVLSLGRKTTRAPGTDYMEAVALGDGVVRARPSLVKSLAALCSIASGATIGREGPLVQLASLAGSLVGRWRRTPPATLRLLVACGAAAGIASAYHAPLAGALFVAEIVIGTIAMESLGPLVLASVAATVTTRALEGGEALYAMPGFYLDRPAHLLSYILLGGVAGVLASSWMRLLGQTKRGMSKMPAPLWARMLLGGLFMGLVALWHPEVAGNGRGAIHLLLEGHFPPMDACALLCCKVLATAVVFGSGAVGGVLTPSLFVGAFSGWLLSTGLNLLHPGLAPDAVPFAVVGMGAFLAGATLAPVMAIVLLLEMTMAYSVVLPVMTATVVAYGVARAMGGGSMYEETLRAGRRGVLDRDMTQVVVRDICRTRDGSVLPSARFGEVAGEFLSAGAAGIWVVDEARQWRGVILLDDVRPFLRDPLLAQAVLALDLARDDRPTVRGSLPVLEALPLFLAETRQRLPVVDHEGRFVGSLGRGDLMLAVSELTRRAGEMADC